MLKVIAVGAKEVQYKEADAAEAITPGHIVMENSAGKVLKNTVAGGAAAAGIPVMVAVENDLFGKGLDDPWALNERVIYAHMKDGCEFYGLAPAAAAAIAYNDPVTTDGAGGVIIGTAANMIGRARSPVAGGAGTPTRVRVAVGK